MSVGDMSCEALAGGGCSVVGACGVDRRTGQGGAAMVLVALAASGVLLGAWLLTGFVDRVAARARAQSAADAAALAGVVEGHRRADSLAQANGATLVEFRIDGEMIEVVVELEGVRAVASAELDLVE